MSLNRHSWPGLAIIAAVLLGASGCRQTDEMPTRASTSASDTPAPTDPGTQTSPGIALSAGRLVLPAVPGRPGAAYFTLTSRLARPTALIAVRVVGTKAGQMHETSGGTMTDLSAVPLAARGTLTFAPGGKHVMVFGIPAGLHPGDTADVTLTFKDGTTLSAPLSVRAPGMGATGAMPGMTM